MTLSKISKQKKSKSQLITVSLKLLYVYEKKMNNSRHNGVKVNVSDLREIRCNSFPCL